jgi:mannose-6-phosphate isomerase-like protein (cupin superfamily)
VLDDKKIQLKAGNSIDIPKQAIHSVANNQSVDLIIIEVQMGDYFGEDDIIRIHDPYKRDEK